jgi:hypothetical protein
MQEKVKHLKITTTGQLMLSFKSPEANCSVCSSLIEYLKELVMQTCDAI